MYINKLLDIPTEYKTINEKLKYIRNLQIVFRKIDNLDMDYASKLYWSEQYYLEQLKINIK